MAKGDPKAWMPLHLSAYERATNRLSLAEDGAYMRLLRDYWVNGPPPDDDAKIARILRVERREWMKIRPSLVGYFKIEGGVWINERIEEELAKARALTEVRRKSGSGGAGGRWGAEDRVEGTRSQRLAAARERGTHTQEEWFALVEVLGNRCVICHTSASDLHGGSLCKDHIRPIFRGGSDAIDNLQPLCRNCNASRGADCTDHRQSDWQTLLAKRLANASQTTGPARVALPSPSPDKDDDYGAAPRFADLDGETLGLLAGRLRDAAGLSVNAAAPRLHVVSPILALLRPGGGPAADLELDVLPAIRAAASKVPRPGHVKSWDYFVPMITEARDRRLQGAPIQEARQAHEPRPHHDAKFAAKQANLAALERGAELAAGLYREPG